MLSGGTETVSSGGTDSGATIEPGGTLQVQSGGALFDPVNFGGDLEVAAGGVVNGGSIGGAATGSGTFIGIANVQGTISAMSIGLGIINISQGGVADGISVDSGGTENVMAGGTVFDTEVTSGGTVMVVSGGSAVNPAIVGGILELAQATGVGGNIDFRSIAGGELRLDDAAMPTNTLVNMVAGDLVDLAGTAFTAGESAGVAGGVLTLTSGGVTAARLNVALPDGTPFSLQADAGGGTVLTVQPCFCRGTRILTARGEVAIEDVRVGERVVTLSGALKPIRWIGMGRDLVTRANRLARPIIVCRDALAENVPHRDLYLTHGHALYLDGVLIPVEHLVNHRTIRWDERAQVVEYYHIELDDHDVLLAEGAPAESYHDAGNRAAFQNTRPGSIAPQPRPTFAPVLHGGEVVEAVWARLLARDGERLEPEMTKGGVYRFVVPRPPTASLLLRSRVGVPSLLGQGRSDHRPLGVAITQLILDQEGIATYLDYDQPPLREAGCHRHEDGFSWTDGDLRLPARFLPPLPRPFTLLVRTEPHPELRYPLPAPAAEAA